MIEKKYFCNLCKEQYFQDDLDKELFGFVLNTQSRLKQERCFSTENHVCRKCIECLSTMAFKKK